MGGRSAAYQSGRGWKIYNSDQYTERYEQIFGLTSDLDFATSVCDFPPTFLEVLTPEDLFTSTNSPSPFRRALLGFAMAEGSS